MSEKQIPEITIETPVEENVPRVNDSPLGEEMKQFGRNLVSAFRSVVHSEEVRGLGNEVVNSLRDIGKDIQETFEQTKSKEEVKAVSEQAKKVSDSVSASFKKKEMGNDLQSSLVGALRLINTELNKIIDQIQSKSARVEADVDSTAKDVKKEESSL